ncbi:MAG: NUDIX domain-containing protein [Proteobacteria bacterium]|nr:NUDIX domain-containing protein [Pseudomonadota bacterium]NBP14818.1 NUDIX domain-containing protein [bacterium]
MAHDTLICSGGLFLSRDTKRFLFLQRTSKKTAGTWGLVGGKKESIDHTLVDTLKREIEEELGTALIDKIVPLELFTNSDQSFQYNTYVLITPSEFIPKLNGEHSGYSWCNYEYWPKPLHRGVRNSFNNKINKIKLKLILDLL